MTTDSIPSRALTEAQGLISYIDNSPSPFHAVDAAADLLSSAGMVELNPTQRWDISPGETYGLRLGDGGILAIRVGQRPLSETGVVVYAAHTDSPALKVKEQGVAFRKGYLVVPTELYGGPIVSTWLDRELTISGRAVLASGGTGRFVFPQPVVIPNPAIHLNREVNKGFEYNPQDHLVAVAGADSQTKDGPAIDWFRESVASSLGGKPSDVLEVDAYLSLAEPGRIFGSGSELLTASRIDNLAGCYTCIRAFADAPAEASVVLALFNHEEVGSMTGEGAQSEALNRLLRRCILAQGGDLESWEIASARSLFVSNDAAHGLHPNFIKKYDADYAPILGGGPVLKSNGMAKYGTTAVTGARFAGACLEADVPMQRMVNRSDMRSGGTVGAMSWARTGMPAVDIGLPILGMHSIRETAGTADVEMLTRALIACATPGGKQ